MSKTFIHFGLQKTGSTFLQKEVFPFLSGVLYVGRPYTQVNESFNRLQYADEALFEEEELANEMAGISKAAGAQSILISDELFAGFARYGFMNRGRIISRLSSICPEAEILLFLRGQEAEIASLHNQYIKTRMYDGPLDHNFLSVPGKGFSLEEWIQGHRGWRDRDRYINNHSYLSVEYFRYGPFLELLRKHFAQVHVFLYEDLCSSQLAVVEKLCRAMRVESTELPLSDRKSRVNQGIPPEDLGKRILENRIERLVPALSGRPARLLARAGRAFAGSDSDCGKEYVRECLERAGIYEDNRRIEREWKLGMDRHPDSYFGSEAKQ